MIASLRRARIEFPKFFPSGSGSGGSGGGSVTLLAAVRAKFASNQTIAGSFTRTDLAWDTEVFDDGWGWTPGGATFTVPSGVTFAVVDVATQTSLAVIASDGYLQIIRNSTVVAYRSFDDQHRQVNGLALGVPVSPGDTLKIAIAYEGGSKTLTASASYVSIRGYST